MATATQSTIQVNDEISHTVSIERKETTATLVIDDTYVSRTTAPGDSKTLEIQNERLYLGAKVDGDGKPSNGFVGCITGAKLNHKDLPVSGSTKDYVANPSPGVESGCSFMPSQGGVFPTVVTFAAGGIGFLLLVIIVPTLIIICIGGRYFYRRRRKYSPSGRRSPTFNWQPVRTPEMANSRQMLMLTQSSQVSASESFALQDMNHSQREGSLAAPSTPRISEYMFTTPEETPEQPARQRHQQESNQQHSPQNNHVRRINFHKQEEQSSQHITRRAKAVEPRSIPKPQTQLSYESTPASPLDTKHTRSFSGHHSIITTATEKSEAISVFDDSEVGRYVFKRIVAANEQMESLSMDQMMPFKEEGEFEPLGSIGSLYDIVKEESKILQNSASKMSRPPLKPKPQRSSKSSHAVQVDSHSIPNGVRSSRPARSQATEPKAPKAEKTDVADSTPEAGKVLTSSHHAKSNGTPPQRQPEKPSRHREKRRRNRAAPELAAGESLMDRFHKISTSTPQAEDEGNFV